MQAELINQQNTIIKLLKEQVETYKQLSEINDSIIEKQKQYIQRLTELLDESKRLLNEALQIIKANQPSGQGIESSSLSS